MRINQRALFDVQTATGDKFTALNYRDLRPWPFWQNEENRDPASTCSWSRWSSAPVGTSVGVTRTGARWSDPNAQGP